MTDVNKIENTAVNGVDVTENLAAAVAKEIPELNLGIEEGSIMDKSLEAIHGRDGTEVAVEQLLNDPKKIIDAIQSPSMEKVNAWDSTAKTTLLQSLAKLGGYPKMKVDGIYRTQTKDFVKVIQGRLGVKVDGYAGSETMPKLIAMIDGNINSSDFYKGKVAKERNNTA